MNQNRDRMLNVIKGEQKRLVRDLLDRGWSLERITGNGHLKLVHSSGESIIVARTTGDHRSWRNLQSEVKRIEAQQ